MKTSSKGPGLCSMLLGLILLACGCNSGSQSASISGAIACDGTPLPAGLIVFSSQSTTCTGRILDGNYKILFQGKNAVPLEEYSVTIFPPDNQVEYNAETNREEPISSTIDMNLFPEKYRSKSTSGISYSPTPGKNEFDISLIKKPMLADE